MPRPGRDGREPGRLGAVTLSSKVLGRVAGLAPARTDQVSVERSLPAKMDDGAVLLADRWFPSGPLAEVPTVLIRTPYGRRQMGMVGRLFAERGYQMVIQSVRGTFGSEGRFDPFRNERADGRATLDWVAGQPWFDGRLATFGPSYLGLTQWAVSEEAPAYLRAMALEVTASDFPGTVTYPGGSFALETGLAWIHQVSHQELSPLRVLRSQVATRRAVHKGARVLPLRDADLAAVGQHVDFFGDWLVHEEPGDPWWEPVIFGRRLEGTAPASLVGGWYDLFLPGQIADYRALRDAGREVRLCVGPWSHVSPGGLAASLRDGLEWFDIHVAGQTGRGRRHPVRVFVMGSRRWVELDDWPPPTVPQPWYLHPEGGLGPHPPVASSPDRYRYDPADPTPGIGGPSLLGGNAGPKDQRRREARSDVLTYTSDPLAGDLTVIGPVRTDLHLRSSLEHTDFFVRLCDVTPQGRSKNLCDGIVRLGPTDVTRARDGSFFLRVDLWPTANTFRRGHRVRLQVSSGAHPLFARNTGSGDRLADATRLCPADQEVLHDPAHPSALVLPVGGF